MPKSAFDTIVDTCSDPIYNHPVTDWSCSDEVRNVLESMGMYGIMQELMYTLNNSKNKREIDLVKVKLQAIGQAVTICKNSTAVYSSTGADDADDGISDISITIQRSDEEDSAGKDT